MSYVRNKRVSWLLLHAHGQRDSIAVPFTGGGTSPIQGSFPAGIQDILNHAAREYLAWSNVESDCSWVFLVGAPGNGKSESLISLSKMLGMSLLPRAAGQPVPRSLPVDWHVSKTGHRLTSGLEVVLVNDASIPRSDAVSHESLFLDVEDCVARITHARQATGLFVNVNRGILVEEHQHTLRNPATTLEARCAQSIIQWLSPLDHHRLSLCAELTPVVHHDPQSPYYRQATLLLPSGGSTFKVTLHAVFLDCLSLLEPLPTNGGRSIDFAVSPPRVAQYRTTGSVLTQGVGRDSTPAGEVLLKVIQPDQWQAGECVAPDGNPCEAQGHCPFLLNVRWLQDPALRNAFLGASRAAEVAAGRRLTYRDLLGHISRCVLGAPEDEWLSVSHPCDWVKENVVALSDTRFVHESLVALLAHRVYNNLFDEGGGSTGVAERINTVYGAIRRRQALGRTLASANAFATALQRLDPAKDADKWNGLRLRLADIAEAAVEFSPSESIGRWAELPRDVHGELEALLDLLLCQELSEEHKAGGNAAEKRGRYLLRWRSLSLLRQVGLALGFVANREAIDAWLAEHENALRRGARLAVGDGLEHLVFPESVPGKNITYIAPLRPRTYSLTRGLPANTLLLPVRRSEVFISIVAEGDMLIADVQEIQRGQLNQLTTLVRIVVDLPIAREALLHAIGDDRPFTEIGPTAFARIERARATLAGRKRSLTRSVVFTDEVGEAHAILTSPSGVPPLIAKKV